MQNDLPEGSTETPKRKRQIILLVLAVLVFASLITLFYSLRSQSKNSKLTPDAQDKTSSVKNIPKYSALYGTWTNNSSLISSYNISSQTMSPITSLPFAIKHVSVFSPSEFLFVDATNDLDQGTKLSIKNIATNSTKTLFASSPGFKIDNYVLSENRKFIAVWEVAFLPNANSILNGRSKVYTIQTSNPSIKNLLYDEVSSAANPVHYPIAVSNTGEVILDTFTPNDGAGWGFGWSTSNLTGTDKKTIPELQNGMVSTRPIQSPSGSLLLVSGYDGSTGPGTTYIGTFRKALIAPNVLEIYDTNTNTLQKINLPNTDRYTPISWQIDSLGFVYKVVSPTPSKNGAYYYDLESNTSSKINLSTVNTTYNPAVLTAFSKSEFLLGNQNNNSVDLSNLGPTYRMSLNTFYFLQNGKTVATTPVQSAQYIGTIKESYLVKSARIADIPTPTPKRTVTTVPVFSNRNKSPNQLQLETLTFKSYLEDLPNQQTPTGCTVSEPGNDFFSDPACNKCVSVAAQTCNNMLGTDFAPSYWVDMPIVNPQLKPLKGAKPLDPSQMTPKYKAFLQCYFQTYLEITVMLCNDSPLYLYGEKGTQVQIRANVPVDNSSAPYNPIDGYRAILDTNGSFIVGETLYDKISFDYVPGVKHLNRPQSGIIIKKEDIEKRMTWYGKQLGLNAKETKDMVGTMMQKATRPYMLVSHFSENVSKQILPLTFNPKPDNYYNIVFYTQGLDTEPQFSLPLPNFEDTSKRDGLTAVEISYISE